MPGILKVKVEMQGHWLAEFLNTFELAKNEKKIPQDQIHPKNVSNEDQKSGQHLSFEISLDKDHKAEQK